MRLHEIIAIKEMVALRRVEIRKEKDEENALQRRSEE
jgi:hypothetical protein